MREENKLNKAIRQDGVDTQSEVLDELRRRYPQYVEQSDNQKAPVKKKRVAVIYVLAAVAACLAIVVPCAVLLPNNGNDSNDENGKIRYRGQNDYTIYNVEYTIGKYHEDNNSSFLYFDWYDFGEDCTTVCYMSNSDNEVLCLKEDIYLPQSNEFVQLSITKANVFLSAFDSIINNCKREQSVSDHKVKWSVDGEDMNCLFEDGEYRYFILIEQCQDENRLFELVAELLGKN